MEEEKDVLDISSAFVSNSAEKVMHCKPVQKDSSNRNKENPGIKTEIQVPDKHPVTILAFEGFNYAREGCFNEAIEKFSEALVLTPDDYRLYANRSLCYLQICQFKK